MRTQGRYASSFILLALLVMACRDDTPPESLRVASFDSNGRQAVLVLEALDANGEPVVSDALVTVNVIDRARRGQTTSPCHGPATRFSASDFDDAGQLHAIVRFDRECLRIPLDHERRVEVRYSGPPGADALMASPRPLPSSLARRATPPQAEVERHRDCDGPDCPASTDDMGDPSRAMPGHSRLR